MSKKKQNKYDDEVKDHISRVVKPIFDRLLQETKKNPMSVGGSVSPTKKSQTSYCLFSPHNYRLYIDFDKTNFNPKPTPQPRGTPRVVPLFNYKIKNKREHDYDNFLGCRIRVKKTQVEVVNKIEMGKQYIIPLGKPNQTKVEIYQILLKKDMECKRALDVFIKYFGGSSTHTILNRHSENKITNEYAIDKLPIDQKFHNKIVKKVYNEKNVEFSDPTYAVTYLTNRAIEDVSPLIANELKLISNTLLNLNINPTTGLKRQKGYISQELKYLLNNVNNVNDVFKYENYVRDLKRSELDQLEVYLFNIGS